MTRLASIAAALLVALLLALTSGCAAFMRAPVQPPMAGVFTNVEAPLDTDMEKTPVSSKRGEASAHNILWLVSWGDASIQRAAEQGGIETIHHADYKFLYVLGIYSQYTTVVQGE